MQKLTDIIEKRLNQHKLGESSKASQVLYLANRLLQEKFEVTEAEIRALTLKEGILKVGTVSSVWTQELWGYQEALMQLIRKEYGERSVMKILVTSLIN